MHCLISTIPLFAMNTLNPRLLLYTILPITIFIFVFLGAFLGILSFSEFKAWEKANSKALHAITMRAETLQKLKELTGTPPADIPGSLLIPETISDILWKGFPVRMQHVQALLGMNQEAFDDNIVDMAIEHGFWIDGDNLVFDSGSHVAFMAKVKELHGRHALLERISCAMTSTGRVSMNDLKEFTRLDAGAMDEQVIDWAIEFGFKIDGDDLVLDQQKAAGFITLLQTFSS